jgi:hypothetical protein
MDTNSVRASVPDHEIVNWVGDLTISKGLEFERRGCAAFVTRALLYRIAPAKQRTQDRNSVEDRACAEATSGRKGEGAHHLRCSDHVGACWYSDEQQGKDALSTVPIP